MEPPTKRVDAGKVIGEAFSTYGSAFAVLIGGAALTVGLAGVLSGASSEAESIGLQALAAITSLVAQAVYTGYVVALVADRRAGRAERGVVELLQTVLPVAVPLTVNALLFGIGIFLGFLALIVPGLFLITIWAVVSPAIVIERVGAIEAFGRSRELVKGDGWAVLGAVILAFLIGIAIALTASLFTAPLDDGGEIISFTLAGILAAPIAALVSSILFFDLGGGATTTVPGGLESPIDEDPGA